MTKDVIELAREAGFDVSNTIGIEGYDCTDEVTKLVALVAARERERVAREFDRRAVLSDGGPAVGWYEPNEPAEIVRALNTEGEGHDR